MARKAVVEVQCERCSRKEMQELLKPSIDAGGRVELDPPAVFQAKLQPLGAPAAQTVSFGDLCSPCQRTVTALFEQIAKKVEGLSPDRAVKPKEAKKERSTPSAPTSPSQATPAPNTPTSRAQAATKSPGRSS